ncbi:BTB/POZ and TAZ domain-containing protein 1-like [Canna indica]|uniref:BTB/POZ and TAZ domain-containing protein 1-like n=1 Tax=Canna indica TaxID=4628 RepID=A0AAQ3KW57_9LILI|nr:BTB/POZ and TAZ domain-containing protein 1-like [Canna indica]
MSTPTTDPTGFQRDPDAGNDAAAAQPADVQILVAGKRRIPAHSSVLSSASPVFESMLERPQKRGGDDCVVIPINGVPYDAVNAFVRLIYSARWAVEETAIGEHGVHLLVLSHVYQVAWLKRTCERALASQLAAEGVVDVLVLARRCDAPWLHLRCMKLIAEDFAAVKRSEAWRFLQENDPFLELDILQAIQDTHSSQKRRRRRRMEQRLYTELGEAMECLQHICTEGCTEVQPSGREAPPRDGGAGCPNPATCRGLQHLIRHLASCDRKKKLNGCPRCKRLWQLLRLHASICDQPEACKVPLCS